MSQLETSAPPDADRRSLLALVGLRLAANEARPFWVLFWLHFLLLAFQYASKSVRQATYVDALGATRLPWVYLLVALASVPVLALYGRVAARWPLRRVLAVTSLVVAASMAAFWWLFGRGVAPKAVSLTFYLWIALVGVFLISQLWTLAGQRLDPRQAKRLFAFIGAGGLLGGIAGGQIAVFASRFETRAALLAAGVVLVLAAGLALALPAGGESSPARRRRGLPRPEVRAGLRAVRGSRYLRLIAALVLLSTMVAQVVDLQFSWVVEERTRSLDQRTAVFGLFYSVMGVAALLFQLLFTVRIHRRLGVAFALRVLPVGTALGSVLFLAAGYLAPGLLLPAAWLLKIGDNGLRYGLDQTTRELLFLPVPARARPRAKVFVDVTVQRAAKGLAALILLAVTFGWIGVVDTAWLALAWIGCSLVLVSFARRHYVAAYRHSLLSGEPEIERGLDFRDAATLEILIEGLGSAEPREVVHSLTLLASHGRGRLVPPLMLRHPDAAVRIEVLGILAAEGRDDAVELVEELLAGDDDERVRAAAIRALTRLRPESIQTQMAARLADSSPRVRAAAVGYLVACDDPALCTRARTVLAEMRTDGEPEVRRAVALALGEIAAPIEPNHMVQLLYDADAGVVRAAIASVRRQLARGIRQLHYAPILVSRLRDRRLKHEARDALVAYGEPVIPALQHFMRDRQEQIWVRRALPKTIARIGGHTALAALVAELAAPDPFLRRKVIEALARLRADGGLCPDPAVVEGQIAAECHQYLKILIDLASLRGPDLPTAAALVRWPRGVDRPHLLDHLLADRLRDHLRNLFGLLALLHPSRDIHAAWRGLRSDRSRLRAHALEYLDNLLAGETRRLVFALIDDLSLDERLQRVTRHFVLVPTDRRATLRRLATHRLPDDADAAWITAAALHYVVDHRLADLYPVVHRAAQHDDSPLVHETAEYLTARIERVTSDRIG